MSEQTASASGPSRMGLPPKGLPPGSHRTARLRSHLVALALAVLLPGLGIGAAATWQAATAQREIFEQRLMGTAQALAATVDIQISARLAALVALAAGPQLDPGGDLAGFHDRARGVGEELGTWFVLGSADGRNMVANTLRPYGTPLPGGPPPEGGATARAIASGEAIVGDLNPRGPVVDAPVVPIVLPVWRDGRPTWLLGTVLTPESLSRTLANFGLEGGTFATLVDSRGQVVSRSAEILTYVGRAVPAWYAPAIEGRREGLLRGPSIAGREMIYAFARLRGAPGWTVVAAAPYAEYAGGWRQPFLALLLGSAAVLALGLALATLLGRELLRPVSALARQAEAVAAQAGSGGLLTTTPSSTVTEFETLRRALFNANSVLGHQVEAERAATAAANQAAAALAESEARLQSVVDTAVDGILVADAEGRIVTANPAAVTMFGYADKVDVVGRELGMLMPRAEAIRHADHLARHKDGTLPRAIGVPGRELTAVRCDGTEFLIEASVGSFVCGGQRFFTGVVRDAMERKRAEEQRILLAREVDHRAKNALAVALSLLRLTPRDNAARFAASVEGRVAAMARAHSLLARQNWIGADLRALAEGELAANADRVRLSGPAIRLAPEAVQPMAMLLNELGTNALKHGALSGASGQVSLSWKPDGQTGNLQMRWQEHGGPPVIAAPGRRGFGSRLIASLTGQQLGGSVNFDWAEAGMSCTIEIAARYAALGDDACGADALAPMPGPDARDLQSGAMTAPVHAAPETAVANGFRPRVLVVEDEALLGMELEAIITEAGCEVIGPARTLADAVRLAVNAPALDAAILDVNLGQGDFSFPAADLLRTRGVPRIFATGYGSSGAMLKRDHGAVAVLGKPYQRGELEAALAAALRLRPSAKVNDCGG